MKDSDEKNVFNFNIIQRIKNLKDFEKKRLIKSGNFNCEFIIDSFFSELKNEYQKKFEDKKIEDYFKGKIIKNSSGECYSIIDEKDLKITCSKYEKIQHKYYKELKIVNGIGQFYENKLIKEGYKTLNELAKHPRLGKDAKEIQGIIDNKNGLALLKLLERKYPKSHELVFLISSFYELEDFIFIDIETLGIYGYPLFLIGIAYFNQSTLVIEQVLARNISEEASVLVYLSEKIKTRKAIVTYNGKSFDLPAINNRLGYYGFNSLTTDYIHFDIYHFSRTAFKNEFNNYKLTTVENKLFNIVREHHIPSHLVPEYYDEYRKTQNIGSLVLIIEHNKQDIISTVKIFQMLHELWG